MRLQKMSQGTLLPLTLEEDLGLSNLATKNDQRTFAWFCHLELIRYELGFLGNLDEELLVPPLSIPMRMAKLHLVHLLLAPVPRSKSFPSRARSSPDEGR